MKNGFGPLSSMVDVNYFERSEKKCFNNLVTATPLKLQEEFCQNLAYIFPQGLGAPN